ncbi:MAG: hypothetical protein M3Z24_08210, partial [Chloroflexota bacterium]|nr:hypothetical protein [Chloroflexota bacterium]
NKVYNAALAERKEAWRMAAKSISYYEQKRDLVEIQRNHSSRVPEHRFACVTRCDLASRADVPSVLSVGQEWRKARGSCFKGRNWYDSFTYPDGAGWKLNGNRLHLSKIGTVKVRPYREMEGKIKALTIKREGEHWYCVFTCEGEAEKLPASVVDRKITGVVPVYASLPDRGHTQIFQTVSLARVSHAAYSSSYRPQVGVPSWQRFQLNERPILTFLP